MFFLSGGNAACKTKKGGGQMAANLTTGPRSLAEHEAQSREAARRYDAIYGQVRPDLTAAPVRDGDLKSLRDALWGE